MVLGETRQIPGAAAATQDAKDGPLTAATTGDSAPLYACALPQACSKAIRSALVEVWAKGREQSGQNWHQPTYA